MATESLEQVDLTEILLEGSFTSKEILFTLENYLSEGMSASVHVASSPHFTNNSNKLFAMKSYKDDHLNLIHNELHVFRRILSEINHEFILKAFASCYEEDEYSVIFFEYINGGSLDDYIISNPTFSPTDYILTFILAEISEGLNMLHNIGVLHQDIKGSNILIRNDGHLTIVDFGVSATDQNSSGYFRRTIFSYSRHLAPEVSMKSVLYFDKSVDYYSLGILIYFLCNLDQIDDCLDPLDEYNNPQTFESIPCTLRKAITGLLNPKRFNRICNDNRGNISLILEPGIRKILWSELGENLSVNEIKEKIRNLQLKSPFKSEKLKD